MKDSRDDQEHPKRVSKLEISGVPGKTMSERRPPREAVGVAGAGQGSAGSGKQVKVGGHGGSQPGSNRCEVALNKE